MIVADGANAKQLESLQMGCVTLSARHFDDGAITEKRMKRARLAVRMELEPVKGNEAARVLAFGDGRCADDGEVIVTNAGGGSVVAPVLVDDPHRTHENLPRSVALALRTQAASHQPARCR